jgi:hypothetical protein
MLLLLLKLIKIKAAVSKGVLLQRHEAKKIGLQ